MTERLGVVGTGAIACGLAATAASRGEVVMLARSEVSAERARATVTKLCGKLDEADAGRIRVVTERHGLADASFVVEAIAEDLRAKGGLLAELGGCIDPAAILATTTSSLSIADLASASGRPDRFVGLHVFNPVPRMRLVELAFPPAASEQTRSRARTLCEALGKVAVVVPDVPGFVVNRLLFPYLFSAVRLLEETGMEPEQVDTCMTLGAGHPMGPLALLDFVGLDVAQAIGETIGSEVPARVRALVADGALGRKSGRGFYAYP